MSFRRSYRSSEASQPSKAPKTPEQQREALMTYAFNALGAKALSSSELRKKLQARSDDPELVESVLARVQELGYQNDEEVARIEARKSGVGQFRVRQSLKRRGLSSDLIQETLDEIDPDEERAAALHLLSRRWPSMQGKRDPRASAYGLLARRGFPSSIIWDVIKEVTELAMPDDFEE